MITMFIIIFCGTIYLLGWLAIMILETVVQSFINLFKRLFKLDKKDEPIADDEIVEIQATDIGEWGRL